MLLWLRQLNLRDDHAQEPRKLDAFGALCVVLFHDEFLGFSTSTDEVDATCQIADVDAVGTHMTFDVHHFLTHDVVNYDVSILAEDDIELTNGRVGIDGETGAVLILLNALWEELVQVDGKALIVVVIGIVIAAVMNITAGLIICLTGYDEHTVHYGDLGINEFGVIPQKIVSDLYWIEPIVAAIDRTRDEEFEIIVVCFYVEVVKVQGHPNGNEFMVMSGYFAKDGHCADAAFVVTMMTELFRVDEGEIWVSVWV